MEKSFTCSMWSFSVSELAIPGAEIGRISATDADLGENAKLEYTILEGETGDTFNITGVNQEAVITLNKASPNLWNLQSTAKLQIKHLILELEQLHRGLKHPYMGLVLYCYATRRMKGIPSRTICVTRELALTSMADMLLWAESLWPLIYEKNSLVYRGRVERCVRWEAVGSCRRVNSRLGKSRVKREREREGAGARILETVKRRLQERGECVMTNGEMEKWRKGRRKREKFGKMKTETKGEGCVASQGMGETGVATCDRSWVINSLRVGVPTEAAFCLSLLISHQHCRDPRQ
ncbi:hypothetical protein CRENBAI_010241 [Crenichthys baileyi]|uniref:Cadherin domain-containing protein n=1 Tax=Crenichthys baileyi TaxID=28760 RepID=A0AAV9S8F3_9TELE